MIDRRIAQAQTSRMEGLPYFPKEDAAISEIVDALETCDSESHCVGVVSEFAQWGEKCPTPSQIHAAIISSRPTKDPEWAKTPPPKQKCECGGWGLIGERCKQTFCPCPIGQSLRRNCATWKVVPYEPTLYTPETWLAMVNKPPIIKKEPTRANLSWLFGERTEKRARVKKSK
jgi:hypothetical protein